MSRLKENEAAFSEGEQQIGKLRLRPFTIGTLSIWAQSAPLGEVLRCIRTGKWVEAVEEFEFTVEPNQINEIVEEINRISRAMKAAAVDVEEKPTRDSETAPPN